MANKPRRAAQPASGSSHWQGWLLSLLVLAGVAQLAHLYLTQPGRLPLRVVEVNGEFTHLVREQIEHRVADNIEGGFFTVDMARVRQAVLDMPWVAEVGVRRVWPDTLRMQVTEQLPLARWGEGALVNLHGEVFVPDSMPDSEGLALLSGAGERAPQMVTFYLKLRSQLVGSGLRIAELSLNPRQEWLVHFDDGLELVLGREHMARRFDDFMKVHPQLLAHSPQRPQRIDMRYEHGFAVRWQPQTADIPRTGSADGDS